MPDPSLSYGSVVFFLAVVFGLLFGFDIMEATGQTSGTVYPALEWLEARGFVSSKWESEAEAHRDGRPARRYFALTATGATALKAALVRYKALRPVPGLAES